MPFADSTSFALLGEHLPDDALVSQFQADEALSRPFRVDVDFSTKADSFVVEDLINQRLLLKAQLSLTSKRYFDGVVSQARFVRVAGERLHFRIRLSPSIFASTQREDCRIFHEATVSGGATAPNIIKLLQSELGLTEQIRWDLTKSYEPRDFCVQYRESTFNFMQRLCEEEGIFYFFEHTEEGHMMVFADDLTSLEVLGAPIPLALGQNEVGHPLMSFIRRKAVRTSSVSLRDFDPNQPAAAPHVDLPTETQVPQPRFIYPAGFKDAQVGKQLASATLCSARWDAEQGEGEVKTLPLLVGSTITLTDAAEQDANASYYVTKLRTSGRQFVESDSHANTARVLHACFGCVPTDALYLPAPKARRPRISGVQTAVVMGEDTADQSIHVDALGRIKVHFHWDRMQPSDANSSCWVRVNQLPMGGSMILPRVGWEVSVAFLEGDPNRPLVIGRVYNGENMPPLALPAAKASGSFTSMSSPGGAGSNGISMGDSGGAQGFGFKAQKDLNFTTGYDQVEKVTVNDTTQINANYSRSVAVDESLEVGGNQTSSTGAHQKCKVGGCQSLSVGGTETDNATGNYLESVTGARSFTVSGNQLLLCNGEKLTAKGQITREVGAVELVCTPANISHNITGPSSSTVGAARVHIVGGDHGETVSTGKAITVAAAVARKCKGAYNSTCSGAVVHLIGGIAQRKISGDLTIKAKAVMIVGGKGKFKGGSGLLDLAGGPITIKGSTIAIKAAMVKGTGGSMKLG